MGGVVLVSEQVGVALGYIWNTPHAHARAHMYAHTHTHTHTHIHIRTITFCVTL